MLRESFEDEMYLDIQLMKDGPLSNYRLLKHTFGEAPYLHVMENFFIRRNITKLRICDLKIESNTLRNIQPPIAKSDRLCKKCDLAKPGDEVHFLFFCPYYSNFRDMYLSPVIKSCSLLQNLNSTNTKNLCALGRYVLKCLFNPKKKRGRK